MAKYKAYPEYKDSGVEWLGKIPTHWICTQIKYGYDITLGKMLQKNKSSSKDELKPYLKAQNIQPKGIDLSVVDNMWFSPDEKNKLLLKNNDVLISEGGDVGRSALWQGQLVECYIQNAINRARAIKGNSPYFLNYWMVYLKSADFINTLCNKATIPHYTAEKVETSPLLLPNCDEQLHISLFLDHETAKIDNLIEKQQQLIELLKEKRQAVISHAVTKGLNPDVQMKDSGVEWLGEVPAHWKVSKLKYFASIQGGFAFSSDSFTHEGIQILRIGNLYQNNLELERQPIFLDVNELDRFRDFAIYKDDILMSLTGTLGKRDYGFAIKVDRDDVFLLNQRVAKITPDETRLCRDFLLYILWSDSYLNQLYSLPSGTKQANLSNSNVTDILVACPAEISEQKSIIEIVTKQMEVFDSLMDNSLILMESLQERRTALISAAVTGKIDVRDWVAPETQDVEEPEEATA